MILGRLSIRCVTVRTRDRLLVVIQSSLLDHSRVFPVAYGWGCEIAAFIVERLTGQTMEAYWYRHSVLLRQGFFSYLRDSPCSQEHIFGPLGMTKTSFYLTADLKSDLVRLAYKQDGQFQKWASRLDILEQDVSKGM